MKDASEKIHEHWLAMVSTINNADNSASYVKAVRLLTWMLSEADILPAVLALTYETKSDLIERTLAALWPGDRQTNAPLLSSLVVVAGFNDVLAESIRSFGHVKVQRRSRLGKTVGRVLAVASVLLVLCVFGIRRGCNGDSEQIVKENRDSRELFVDESVRHGEDVGATPKRFAPIKPLEIKEHYKLVLPPTKKQKPTDILDSSWSEVMYATGASPICFNYTPKYKRSIDNYLRIVVGSGTDVVIKVMEMTTEKCIRYVFIRSGTTHSIKNIPEGLYYLKIAYGRRWVEKVENGECLGRFASNPLYEKGEEILDYHITRTGRTRRGDDVYENLSIPSFEVQLDVTSTGLMNSFDTDKISEASFNQ